MPFDLETPAFVIDGDALLARAICLSRGLDNCQFLYSVKTLAVPEAVLIAREAGWLIEVVSRDEYDFVRAIGVRAEEIILNGPSKDDDLLKAALSGGARVHADSEEELRRAASIRATVASGRLGVRLGFGVTDPRWARFGIDTGDLDSSIRVLAQACNGQVLNGFHVHSEQIEGVYKSSWQSPHERLALRAPIRITQAPTSNGLTSVGGSPSRAWFLREQLPGTHRVSSSLLERLHY